MVRNPRLALLLAAMAALAITASSCIPQSRQPGAVLRLNLSVEPPSADPALVEDNSSIQVDELLFLGLTDLDEETSEPLPELATRWEVSADGLVWTFQMRQDVPWVQYNPATGRFSNKRLVTAHDVEYAIKRALEPATASPYAYVLFIIKNAEPFHVGRLADAGEVGVRAAGDYAVEFTLERPAAYFPIIVSMWVARPVPREAIEQFGYKWTEAGNIWTNGPYALESWEHERTLTILRNPSYYKAREVAIEHVHWSVMPDDVAAFAQYKEGKLDVCTVPVTELAAVKADAGLSRELHVTPYMGTYYLGFNTTKPPFDNRLVRQAFSYALDRSSLIAAVSRGEQVRAKSFAGPGVFGSPVFDAGYAGATFDPELARTFLADAGYPGGRGLPEITLTYYASQLHRQVAESAQRCWRDVLGVEVKVTAQEVKAFLDALRDDAPQIFSSVWMADYPDEDNWVFQNFHSAQGANRIRWQNAEFDRLVEEARTSTDLARRRELYARAEQILCVDEAAIVPVFHPARSECTKPYVVRTYSPLGNEHIDTWTIKAH
ncbi:MAG TPA: peptide ABC transporter substrate-binding protein [Anaerolineae bacterium]|nr:peptide ABC transporter substrate-binding protein [Anaerolineae bacterium]HPL29367.1 peptide ABC transporter substrate-binding protein [Anaerolineae bacterium]